MTQFQGNTGETHDIELPSAIEQVLWTRPIGAPGSRAGIEIHTSFVGNGAALRIELTDNSGKNHGSFVDKIYGNRFWAEILVPEKADTALFVDVELPDHKLDQRSGPLLLLPPFDMTNLKWSRTETHRGEILKITADITGVADGRVVDVTIWEHSPDGAHEQAAEIKCVVENQKIECEWQYDYFNDTARIPGHDERKDGYERPAFFFGVALAGISEQSDEIDFEDWIEIVLKDAKGVPFAGEECVLTFADGSSKDVHLDDHGTIRLDDIPPGKVHFRIKGEEDT